MCDTVMRGIITTLYTPFEQLADIFTKELDIAVFESLRNILGMLDIYVTA